MNHFAFTLQGFANQIHIKRIIYNKTDYSLIIKQFNKIIVRIVKMTCYAFLIKILKAIKSVSPNWAFGPSLPTRFDHLLSDQRGRVYLLIFTKQIEKSFKSMANAIIERRNVHYNFIHRKHYECNYDRVSDNMFFAVFIFFEK